MHWGPAEVLTGHWYAAHQSGASFAGLAIIVSGQRGAQSSKSKWTHSEMHTFEMHLVQRAH